MGYNRGPEVEARSVQEKVSVLDEKGPIKTQLVSEGLHVTWMPPSEQHDLGWIAGDKVNREKGERQHAPQHGDGYEDAPNRVGSHC